MYQVVNRRLRRSVVGDLMLLDLVPIKFTARYAVSSVSVKKPAQKLSEKQSNVKTVLKSGEFEFRLASALNKLKVGGGLAEKRDAVEDFSKLDLAGSDLSEREKLIGGALGFKGFDLPDWQSLFKTIEKKPKLNIEVVKLVFELAINGGNERQLIYFACLASKNTQQLVAKLLKGRKNWASIEITLDAFWDDSIIRSEQARLHKSTPFLSSIIEQQNKSQFISKLVLIASKIENQLLVKLTKLKMRAILTDIAKILLSDEFDSAFADAFSVRKSDDEIVGRLIRNFNEYLVSEKQLVDFILKLLAVSRKKAVLNRAIFSKFNIETIASLAVSNEVREFVLNERDCLKIQTQNLLRQGGVGALMQLLDQKMFFDLIVDPELVTSHFSSKTFPSTKVVELLASEIIRKSGIAVMEAAAQRSKETKKERDRALDALGKSEKQCAEFQIKLEVLENQLRAGKKEQIVRNDRVTQQAQLQVLIEFSKFVEDLRVLVSGSFAEDESVRSVFRNAEKQLRALKVAIIGVVGKEMPVGEECFKSVSPGIGFQKIVDSPAYVFRGADHDVVLVWGELRSAT